MEYVEIEKKTVNNENALFERGKDDSANLQKEIMFVRSLNDSRYYCFDNDEEKYLGHSKQTCLNISFRSQKPKEKKNVYHFYSPLSTRKDLVEPSLFVLTETEDNYFEGVKPILPMADQPKSITERINFASSKAGAIAIAKSKGMSGNSELLTANKYKYAITNCKTNKWFIFSLSDMVFEVSLTSHSLIRSFTHQSLIHSLSIHSFAQSLIHSLIHSPVIDSYCST